MKTKLKVKISLVLATSIIINIFLIWEVFRLRDENRKITNQGTSNSQSLEDYWNDNQPSEKGGK
ncbi:MAG: hypothetical protein P8P49_08840 [Opitutales bacterium]|nr:hypothetical protein [Opitutales bacterium]MDG1325860.1 hypothetical protein [Opitutales bacterium]